MEEIKSIQPEQAEKPAAEEDAAKTQEEQQEELKEAWKKKVEEIRKRAQEAQEAMGEGKGCLTLETPITSGDKEIKELVYDFTAITGLEYTEAMDSDLNANSTAYRRITYRQALSLFAMAAAKQTEGVDMTDIVGRIGGTDAVEGVQLATVFFTASTRAGQLRISKKS